MNITCYSCGRVGPADSFKLVPQISNPVRAIWLCKRRWSCIRRSFRTAHQ